MMDKINKEDQSANWEESELRRKKREKEDCDSRQNISKIQIEVKKIEKDLKI